MEARPTLTWLSLVVPALGGAWTGVLLAFGLHFGLILGTCNERTVLPDLVYRSAQPSPASLERLVRVCGIRTVLNLRGCSPTLDWYRQEARATAALSLSQEDVVLSAGRMPSPLAIRQLVEALDRSPKPILLHCQQGVDRTGLAAAVAVLLYTDATPTQAQCEMCLASGHVALGRTRHIGRFFTTYREWLDDLELEHRPAVFRVWASRHYVADGAQAEWISPTGPIHAAPLLRVRCRNRSPETWRFRADPCAGIHARWQILDREGRGSIGTVGLFDADVPPGGEIELKIPCPPLGPGRYRLLVELAHEQHATFSQLGSPPLDIEVAVP